MILPTALATNEILPSNLRAVGLIPLIFFLPALGLGRTAAWLGRRWSRLSLATTLFPLLLLAVLGGGGALTASAYFRDWAGRPDVFYETDADLTAVAAYLDQQSRDRTTYLAALHYRHPTIAFLTDAYAALKWLPGSEAIVFPATGSAVYIYPHNSPAPDWLSDHLPTAPAPGPAGPDGEPTFVIYEVSTPPPIRLVHQSAVNFGGHVNLLGYELGPAGAGKELTVTLLWRVLSRPAGSYLPFIQLEDAEQRRWAQLESGAYPSEQWEVGETVLQQMVLPIPPGAPPGQYRLRLGFFSPDTGEQLVRLDSDGRFAGAAFVIEPIFVSPGSIPEVLPTPPVTLNKSPLPGLTIVGYEPPPATVATGSTLTVALWWTATAAPGDLITRLELIRADNTGRILLDSQPVYGTYPFAEWQTPLFLIDPLRALIPADFPTGDYELLLRLIRADGGTLLEQRLGPVQVEATERLFTPPPFADALTARFGGEIDLLGYDLTAGSEDAFELNLILASSASAVSR